MLRRVSRGEHSGTLPLRLAPAYDVPISLLLMRYCHWIECPAPNPMLFRTVVVFVVVDQFCNEHSRVLFSQV